MMIGVISLANLTTFQALPLPSRRGLKLARTQISRASPYASPVMALTTGARGGPIGCRETSSRIAGATPSSSGEWNACDTSSCVTGTPAASSFAEAALTPAVVRGVLLSSDAEPLDQEQPSGLLTFKTPSGHSINCKSPLTKAALRHLREQWPMPVSFSDLYRQCGNGDAGAEEFLAGEMLTCMAAGVVEWRLSPVPFTIVVDRTPAATPLARLQAERGYKVTNLRGETIVLDEIHRQTLKQLDGKRDLGKLTESLMAALKRGELVLQRDSDKAPVTDEGEMKRLLGPALEKVLANLAKKALLARPHA